ncbi:hypothetical protein SeMB42_g06222 [Synchytrium endobioticum]|uniref:Mannosyltransferase n=1 Tax=Synchytrium endobioticum TaxID=286115 RepID=A0A507CJJ8_9FUNG|nr:hypothetical protein SeMB42_g06222 [Synchytrium endobioticum]
MAPRKAHGTSARQASSGSQQEPGSSSVELLLDGGFLALVTLYAVICPFTKVEESFHIHATHDILVHGPISIANYDHFTFPGAVPRSFIPPLVLSAASSILVIPLHHVLHLISKFQIQIIVRITLGAIFAFSIRRLRESITYRFGRVVGRWFMLICMTEFHLCFYATRTLSNTFAMIACNHALALWIHDVDDNNDQKLILDKDTSHNSRHGKHASDGTPTSTSTSTIHDDTIRTIQLLTFTAATLRAEILLLLFSFLFTESLIFNRIPFTLSTVTAIFQIGYQTSILSIAVAISIDMHFWNQFVWAEAKSFLFNIVHGKSVEWGVEPFWTYWSKYIPKLAPIGLPLAIIAIVCSDEKVRSGVLRYLAPAIIYTAIYSIVPHKEWRFIIYTVPLINLAASIGITWTVKFTKSIGLGTIPQIVLLLAAFMISFFQVYISSLNYPGGVALAHLHQIVPSNESVFVHMDVYTCMTGATLFGQLNDATGWRYSKNETLTLADEYLVYSHLITASPHFHLNGSSHWVVMDTINGIRSNPKQKTHTTFIMQYIPQPSLFLIILSLSSQVRAQDYYSSGYSASYRSFWFFWLVLVPLSICVLYCYLARRRQYQFERQRILYPSGATAGTAGAVDGVWSYPHRPYPTSPLDVFGMRSTPLDGSQRQPMSPNHSIVIPMQDSHHVRNGDGGALYPPPEMPPPAYSK